MSVFHCCLEPDSAPAGLTTSVVVRQARCLHPFAGGCVARGVCGVCVCPGCCGIPGSARTSWGCCRVASSGWCVFGPGHTCSASAPASAVWWSCWAALGAVCETRLCVVCSVGVWGVVCCCGEGLLTGCLELKPAEENPHAQAAAATSAG